MEPESTPTSGELQVQVRFETKLPKEFHVPATTFAVPASLTRYGLSEVVNTLLGSADKPQPFDFLVQGSLLRSSLYKSLLSHGLSTESAVVVEYVLAATPPEPQARAVHEDWVSALCCSLPCGVVVSGSYDATVRVFTAQALGLDSPSRQSSTHGGSEAVEERAVPEPQALITGHTGAITSVSLARTGASPGGEGDGSCLVLSGSKDHRLRLARVTRPSAAECLAECVAVLAGHTSAVQCCQVNPTGQEACSGSWDGEIKIWSLVDGEGAPLGAASEAQAAAEDAQGSASASASASAIPGKAGKKKRKVDPAVSAVRQVEAQCTLTGHTGAVAALEYIPPPGGDEDLSASWLPLGEGLVSGSWDHSLRIWDRTAQVTVHTLTTAHPVLSVSACSGDHQALIASGGASRALLLWDTRAKGTTGPAQQLTSHKSWISSVKWCRSRAHPHLLLSGSYDGTVKLWDTRSTVPLHTAAAHPKNKVFCADWWDPDAFLSGGSDCKMRLFQHTPPS